MSSNQQILAIDYGDVRVGIAIADRKIRIAIPYATFDNDSDLLVKIAKAVVENNVTTVVLGYPRNQAGEPTMQTAKVEDFAKTLEKMAIKTVFQDESLTSVIAEERLKQTGKKYTRGDIDAYAAAIILEDYININY